MTTRPKYWLHISSTNQATSQVNTAVSPQTARNFGLDGTDQYEHERIAYGAQDPSPSGSPRGCGSVSGQTCCRRCDASSAVRAPRRGRAFSV
jgi:hypothetical protein